MGMGNTIKISNGHGKYHLDLHELERRLSLQKGVENLIEASNKVESEKNRTIFEMNY